MSDEYQVKTFVYKKVSNLDLTLDVHFSPSAVVNRQKRSGSSEVPAVVFLHPGGLAVGSKDTWIPRWLSESMVAEGYLFIIPEYQLMPPATGHEILHDIRDFFIFLPTLRFTIESQLVQVDYDRIALFGSSGGGLCCCLATDDDVPVKAKAILSLYGMGGDFFSPHYLKPKTEVFFRGYELLDPGLYSKYLYPFNEGPLKPIVHSPPIYNPPTHSTAPGYPADPRMKLPQLFLQMGVYHDYFTGEHNPSISEQLRNAILDHYQESNPDAAVEMARKIIPFRHHELFPQLNIASANWPPTLLVHGTADTAVPISESRNLQRILKATGVAVDLIEVEGQEHSFDFRANARTEFKAIFEQAIAFMKEHLEN